MWIINWNLNDVKRVVFGKKKQLKCTKCERETTFYEANAEDRVAAYVVLELYKRTKRVMQCGDCLGVCDFYDVFPEERESEAKHKEELKLKEAEAKAAELEKRKADEEKEAKRLEAERARQEQLENERRAQERERKAKAVDDELSALKKKLGKE